MTADPRIPPRELCVLRDALDLHAGATPDKVFAAFGGGEAWTYGETLRRVRGTALRLRELGVRQGDHVLVWMPVGRESLRVWFAINYLGAVYVPINTAYRGRILEHVVANSDAEIFVVHADLAPRLAEIAPARLRRGVVFGGDPVAVAGLELLAADALDGESDAEVPLERPVEPWDTQSILYTSGTTGPSKGVLSSYLHLYTMGEGFPLAEASDRFLINLPLFHAGGTGPVYWMLTRGGSVAMVGAFSTERFWDTIADTGTTTLILLGVMAGFVMKTPDPLAAERPRLRSVCALPLDENAIAFGRRYDVPLTTVFNMTETSCPLVSEVNPTLPGLAGRPRPGVACRVVDENDCEVAPGTVGELMIRTDRPWGLNHGYYKDDGATARAWRNGWFHTGDGFRVDEAGNHFFVDRMKDAIRRRGENISSFEVESEVCAHPKVREAAVVAVPSEVAEDEVLAVVSLAAGESLDPADLLAFLQPRMAHFMIPRFVRIIEDLPKTPTLKVQKHLLRAEGVTADTWDREAAGIRVRRERIGA